MQADTLNNEYVRRGECLAGLSVKDAVEKVRQMLFQSGHASYTLHKREAAQQMYLSDHSTSVWLPAGFQWKMHSNPNGKSYVSTGVESRYCEDSLTERRLV